MSDRLPEAGPDRNLWLDMYGRADQAADELVKSPRPEHLAPEVTSERAHILGIVAGFGYAQDKQAAIEEFDHAYGSLDASDLRQRDFLDFTIKYDIDMAVDLGDTDRAKAIEDVIETCFPAYDSFKRAKLHVQLMRTGEPGIIANATHGLMGALMPNDLQARYLVAANQYYDADLSPFIIRSLADEDTVDVATSLLNGTLPPLRPAMVEHLIGRLTSTFIEDISPPAEQSPYAAEVFIDHLSELYKQASDEQREELAAKFAELHIMIPNDTKRMHLLAVGAVLVADAPQIIESTLQVIRSGSKSFLTDIDNQAIINAHIKQGNFDEAWRYVGSIKSPLQRNDNRVKIAEAGGLDIDMIELIDDVLRDYPDEAHKNLPTENLMRIALAGVERGDIKPALASIDHIHRRDYQVSLARKIAKIIEQRQ